MITITPEPEYDCIYVELADANSRVQIHIHAQAGTRDIIQRELRQIEVSSRAETVFAMDNVDEKLPCDPHGLGEANVYSGYDYGLREDAEQNEDRGVEEDPSDVADV